MQKGIFYFMYILECLNLSPFVRMAYAFARPPFPLSCARTKWMAPKDNEPSEVVCYVSIRLAVWWQAEFDIFLCSWFELSILIFELSFVSIEFNSDDITKIYF